MATVQWQSVPASPQPVITETQITKTVTTQQAVAPSVSNVSVSGAPDGAGYERRVSSTILEEEYLEKFEGDSVRYVEVPEIVEVPKYVTKKSVVEVEKRVPKYEVEYVERVVEVPQTKYVDKYVEVPQVQEVVKHVPKKEVVFVNTEVVKHVPKIETKIVEKIVEVPGEVIEVPKPYVVKNEVVVHQEVDRHVPVVIAQSVHPYLYDSPDEVVDIDVVEHTPQVIEVEVQVPKPVAARIWSTGAGKSYHRVVKDVPPAQYNTLLKLLNPHLSDPKLTNSLPFVRDMDGTVQMLQDQPRYVELSPDTELFNENGQVYTPPQRNNSFQVQSRGILDEAMRLADRGVSEHDHMHTQSVHSEAERSKSKHSSSKRHERGYSTNNSAKHRGVSQPSTIRKATATSRTTIPKKSRACAC